MFDDPAIVVGTSVLVLFEFEMRLKALGLARDRRAHVLQVYLAVVPEILSVEDSTRIIAAELRDQISSHLSAMDSLIAATAIEANSTLVHRDAHFAPIPTALLRQMVLPAKR